MPLKVLNQYQKIQVAARGDLRNSLVTGKLITLKLTATPNLWDPPHFVLVPHYIISVQSSFSWKDVQVLENGLGFHSIPFQCVPM